MVVLLNDFCYICKASACNCNKGEAGRNTCLFLCKCVLRDYKPYAIEQLKSVHIIQCEGYLTSICGYAAFTAPCNTGDAEKGVCTHTKENVTEMEVPDLETTLVTTENGVGCFTSNGCVSDFIMKLPWVTWVQGVTCAVRDESRTMFLYGNSIVLVQQRGMAREVHQAFAYMRMSSALDIGLQELCQPSLV